MMMKGSVPSAGCRSRNMRMIGLGEGE